jgi:hypothetical protein
MTCSLVKTLKSSEQSSIDNLFLHASSYLISASSIASVPYGLLLVLPVGIVPRGSYIAPVRGVLAERIFFHAIFL